MQDKKEGEQHAATAPGQVRAAEAQTLAGTKAQAAPTGATAMTALATERRQVARSRRARRPRTPEADPSRK